MIRTATFALALALSASLAPAQVTTYCTAGTTVQGCVPSIAGIGIPSPYSASGFEIVVDNVPTQRMGLIFYGLNSIPQPQPWAVGSASYLCIYYPVNRTGAHSSGGSLGACDGELKVDFNAWRAANPNAVGSPFASGQVLYAQGWFRDPGAAKQTNLSNGLQFVLAPNVMSGMVAIPSGTFQMGSNAAFSAPYFSHPEERPVHNVTISYPFWMGATEVTQSQYLALMGVNPSAHVAPNNPVEVVSWFDARAYCAALTSQQALLGGVPMGYEFRLPTEAEWEYACRAATSTEFSVGSALVCGQSRFKYSHHSASFCWIGSGPPISVASFPANAWGLYDMHGNVHEWCLDSYASYGAVGVTDPYITGGFFRIIRGGGWGSDSNICRSAARGYGDPTHLSNAVGFRVVLAPILVP